MVLDTKVALFSLINVGSGFHCLRSFSFFLLQASRCYTSRSDISGPAL